MKLPPYAPEPVRRFTENAEREAFAAAIERVRGRLGETYPLVIAGVMEEAGATVDSTNPAGPDEVVGRVRWASVADAKRALEAGEQAFPAWGDRSASERAEYLLKAAAVMRDRRDELAAWEVFEAGKPWREADGDVCEAIDFLEYYAREALRLAEGVWLNAPGETNHYHYQPRGVGAVITPWNFPLAIVTGMTSAALVTGNTVVLKPAPQSPVVASLLIEIMHSEAVNLPPGVLNFLPGPDEVGAALVEDKRTHYVSFTGSQAVGTWINVAGAKVPEGQQHLKHIVAEMGGKNAIIVDDDADPDDAVRGVIDSAYSYAGQKCSACSRAIVVGEQYDVFVQRLVEAARSLRVGDPADPANLVPPVIDAEARQRIADAITRGKRDATCVLEAPTPDAGHYVSPTIFTDVAPDSFLAQDEIFGPVLAVIRADSFDHALAIANGTRYALTGGVYSRSPAHLKLARQRFNVGNLYLNRKITGSIVGRQPFGGFKLSGVGAKAGGPDYLLQFVEARTVTEETLRRGFAPDERTAMDLAD
ncbi:MAG: L-glutamate gamma-semialdehyde dehydrogenase [Phycisphaeraceae bacterium]